MHHLTREKRLDRLPEQPFLRQPAHLVLRREREREVRDDRVHERHARFERPRHRGTVGLGQQIVDEVEAEVEILQPRQELVALRLCKPCSVLRQRIERACTPGEFRSHVRREDLLPAVMTLERREAGRAREALRLVVEAGLPRRLRQQVGQRSGGGGGAPKRREEVGDTYVVTAEEAHRSLHRRARPSHPRPRASGRGVRQRRLTSRQNGSSNAATERRQEKRGVGRASTRGGSCRSVVRPRGRR